MEKKIIKKTTAYLIARDIFLVLLVVLHSVSHYLPSLSNSLKMIIIISAGFIFWLALLIRLIILISKAAKDRYLKSAFKDELFTGAAVKSGNNAFIGMIIVSTVFFIITVITAEIFNTEFPAYIVCESVILSGVIINDASRLILLR